MTPKRSERVDTDIVEQARQHVQSFEAIGGTGAYPFSVRLAKHVLLQQAEIERLRAEMESGNYLTTNDKLSLGIERQALEIKGLQDEIDRLRALPAPSEWRGMETAPKDGRYILVPYPYFKTGNNTDVPDEYEVLRVYWNGVGWDIGGWIIHEEVHLWQPLPAPPGKEKEGG